MPISPSFYTLDLNFIVFNIRSDERTRLARPKVSNESFKTESYKFSSIIRSLSMGLF